MNNNILFIYIMIDSTEIIKYLVYGIVVYLLLTFIPKNKLVLEDKLICTAVVIISVIGLSVIKTKKQEHFDNTTTTPTTSNIVMTESDLDTLSGFSDESLVRNNGTYAHSTMATPTPTTTNDTPTSTAVTPTSTTTATTTDVVLSEDEINSMATSGNEFTDCVRTCTMNDDEESDMKYSQISSCMYTPLGKYDSTMSNSFEYGYAYLNTDKWRVPMPKPPVCKTSTSCTVCPTNTSGYPVDVKEWNSASKIMPPDNISIDYLKKLNSTCQN
jgi:hypothetical protein